MPLFRDIAAKTLTTLRGRRDLLDLLSLYQAFSDMPLISISNAQRAPIAAANFSKTVYHGLPLDLLAANYDPRGYLAFLRRLSQEPPRRFVPREPALRSNVVALKRRNGADHHAS